MDVLTTGTLHVVILVKAWDPQLSMKMKRISGNAIMNEGGPHLGDRTGMGDHVDTLTRQI